jgi:hypothetical protein
VDGKKWSFEKKFLDNFLSNLGSISKNYSSKTENNAPPKFCTLIHNKSKHFPAKFEENRRWSLLLNLTPNIKEKKIGQLVTLFFCPKIDVCLFFLFLYTARPFKNAQTLAFWFSEWKIMTIWGHFLGNFWPKIGLTSKNYFSKTKNNAPPKF